MKAITVKELSEESQLKLEELYRTSKVARLRSRAQMVLLSHKGYKSSEIAGIVLLEVRSVQRWIKRYLAEGIEGLQDAPRSGAPPRVTKEYIDQLLQSVRQRPRSLNLPFSMWTCERLSDYMAEQTGIRIQRRAVNKYLNANGIVLSRPQHKISSPDPEYLLKKRRLK
jgi:transposase